MSTNKKDIILHTALELFAVDGYNSVSTNKIAKAAGVSEGLIFRHFGNKKALLDALMEMAELKIEHLYTSFLFEADPLKALSIFIHLPFEIDPSEYTFWRLQFMLKWKEEYYKPEHMLPIENKLTSIFKELEYEYPREEAQFLNYFLMALAKNIIRNGLDSQLHLKKFLLIKYNI